MIIIVKHTEVALVQVPGAWTPKQVAAEQRRVDRHISKSGAGIHVVIVGGGEGPAPDDEYAVDDSELAGATAAA